MVTARCSGCQRAIGPRSLAFACGYQCTFCAACSERLAYICPNCGGRLTRAFPGRAAAHPRFDDGQSLVCPASESALGDREGSVPIGLGEPRADLP